MLKQLDKETDMIIATYKKTYAYLMRELVKKVEGGLSERHILSVMKEIELTLKNLDKEAHKYVKEVLPEYYLYSVKEVDKQVILMKLQPIAGTSAVLHKNAIERAIKDIFNDLAARTRFMEKEAKKVIRETSKELTERMLITGESRKKVIPELKKGLQAKGVSSFVDNANRNWNLGRYSEMLIRTKTRILTNEGTMDRLTLYQEKYPDNENFDLIQISSHGATDWCREYEGTVWSISGKSKEYPPVSQLPNGYSTLHPNCKHVFMPYIPALRGKGETVSNFFQNKSVTELNKWDYHQRKA